MLVGGQPLASAATPTPCGSGSELSHDGTSSSPQEFRQLPQSHKGQYRCDNQGEKIGYIEHPSCTRQLVHIGTLGRITSNPPAIAMKMNSVHMGISPWPMTPPTTKPSPMATTPANNDVV